jgi:lycopene beta-cyclase
MAGERVIIAGGGLAGALAALALARRRPEVPLLLIEAGPLFGGNHTWSFFDGDVAPGHRALVEPLVARRWGSHDIRFPKRERTLADRL